MRATITKTKTNTDGSDGADIISDFLSNNHLCELG